MSDTPDFTEIARQARRIVIANQAQLRIIQADLSSGTDQPRKRPKFSRSTAGCLVCRRQKVKCDETTPSCLRCISTQRQCHWPSPSEKRTKRKRNASTRSSETRTGPVAGDLPSSDVPSTGAEGQENIGYPAINTAESLQDTTKILPFSPIELSFTPELDFLDSHNAFNPESESPNLMPSIPSCSAFDTSFPQHTAMRTAFTNLSRSSLLSRRAQKMRHPTISLQHRESSGTLTSLRISMVESFVSAFTLDDTLFEFGPSHRNALATTNTNLDLLSNAYPSPVARTLFHHYRSNASRILITMGNIGPNPLLALCTPLMLLNTDSPASAAIRMSMLSTSVAHFTHETEEVVELKRLGPQWPKQKEALQEMGRKFKQAALANMMLAVHGDGGPLYTDSILATCTLICIRDVISADTSWGANLEFAMNYVNRKGGPQAMLKSPDSTFTRRYLIENLATHDVFSCFITGKEPALLGNYDQWWFESVETSQTRWEWESVERTFGMSRAMVDLLSRITVLDSQKRRLGITLSGHAEEMRDVVDHFVREGHCFVVELDIWGNSLSALPQNVRVTCGDYIYKYMAVIFVLADLLEMPIATPRIAKAVDCVLELCSEASAMRMSVMLIWPLLIAGVFCLPHLREKVRSLFDAFHSDYCMDLEVARELLEEQWRIIDAGGKKQPWVDLMRKMDKYVLLI